MGDGANTFNVESTAAGTDTRIITGNGMNLVNISPTAQDLHTIAGALVVDFFGLNPNNQITLGNGNNPGNPSNSTIADSFITADTIPGLRINYTFGVGSGIVDVEVTPPGSNVTRRTSPPNSTTTLPERC